MNDVAYKISGPARISFSGGRTSAYMLRKILDAHGGALPPDVHVVFANTGKERPETLDFVRECGERWGVSIRWVEWRIIRVDMVSKPTNNPPRWLQKLDWEKSHPGTVPVYKPIFASKWTESFEEVSYDTASRKGEPFDRLIDWKQYLPNPMARTCTEHLKIETMKLFSIFELGLDEWTSVIGIRHDEPRRWRVLGQDARDRREFKVGPLVEAKITVGDVMEFWRSQPFDLRLKSDEGNCDLCFLKGQKKRIAILRTRPDLAEWWIGQESLNRGKRPGGGVFRANAPNYIELLRRANGENQQGNLFDLLDKSPDDLGDCACAD
jgi:3'-phosphoadenosine 5'-phosphosulfate sulfotransferase (PAPS reductase)/FAD synthetase